MKPKHTLRNIVVILLLLVLLPTVFYSVYEFSALNANEQILSEMYSRQLDAILYSVNDYAWTVVTNWANTIARRMETGKRDDALQAAALEEFLTRTTEIEMFVLADSAGNTPPRFVTRTPQNAKAQVSFKEVLNQNREKLERLNRYLETGYRKLEPLFIGDSSNGRVVLVFAVNAPRERFVGIVLNERRFIEKVLGTKLVDVAGTNFILGVVAGHTLIFSTEPTHAEQLRQQKPLWLFPGYDLGVRLKGTTIDELARSRTRRNLFFIAALDAVLLAGAWFVYATIRREMELVRIKSDLVSNVSHELRTPLALIRMFAETLEMGRVRSEEKKREYYSTIVKESERLTRLVNTILDFAKMEAGKKEYHFQPANINHVVAEVLNTYSFHLHSEGVTPVVELGKDLPDVLLDKEAVAEAIINLLDNAVKYSGERKFIRIATGVRHSSVTVEIEDHGVGIAPEHQKKIFDTFYRVSSGLAHNTKGSGLGLSLVQHIVDAHGGKVELHSAVGKGSTFRLLFPIHSQQQSS